MFRIRMAVCSIALSCATFGAVAQEAPVPEATEQPAPAAEAPADQPEPAAEAPADAPAFEAEIRKNDESFVAAFNAKDAAAISSLWSPEAVYVDRSTGEEVVGREAIGAQYESLFAASPELKLDIQAESIQLISPGVAVERGTAAFVAPDVDPSRVSFVAVWVRRDGAWLLDRVSDEASVEPSPHYEHLRELEWMIGEWVDQDDAATVETECRWAKNKNFIVREFAVEVDDRIDISGMQVIGWNPLTKKLQSWTFDSDGGFAEGTWSSTSGNWFIRNRGYTSDGGRVAMTNVMRPIDDDSFGWRTVERIVDGELLPNVDEALVVRKK